MRKIVVKTLEKPSVDLRVMIVPFDSSFNPSRQPKRLPTPLSTSRLEQHVHHKRTHLRRHVSPVPDGEPLTIFAEGRDLPVPRTIREISELQGLPADFKNHWRVH